jgi:hypothetical protein
MIDFDNLKIIWISGTSVGNCIPPSGAISSVYYDRSLPIAKFKQEDASVALYGEFPKIIQDKNIKDPRHATDVCISTLAESAYPKEQANIKMQGVAPLNVGMRVPVYLPYHHISGVYNIFGISYTLNKTTCLTDQVMDVTIGEKIPDFTDELKQSILDLRRLQAGDINSTDVLTRIQGQTGSIGNKGHFIISTRNVSGNKFLCDSPVYGILGSSYYAADADFPSFAAVYSGGEW